MKKIFLNSKIRLSLASLIFLFPIPGCDAPDKVNNAVNIEWDNGKATGLHIPGKLVFGVPADSLEDLVKVHLSNSVQQLAILGEYRKSAGAVLFVPLLPFSQGLNYEIRIRGKAVASISIPSQESASKPNIVEVYPSGDTVPENLLKFYVQFSQPMKDGDALEHIRFTRNDDDSAMDVFLDLRPELWNSERTILTLWLDPGRLKRGLQPNQRAGTPIREGKRYTLTILDTWTSANGRKLEKGFNKSFYVGGRDMESPSIVKWKTTLPRANSTDTFRVVFGEPMDQLTAIRAVRIINEEGEQVPGSINLNSDGSEFHFIPDAPWVPGSYDLDCLSIIEDIAGNNLNRLFDADLRTVTDNPNEGPRMSRSFIVR
ncbi:MAG: Ig-like domain-containing protein [Chitinophagaceae bacterium]|nr:Ig-like domain-containing protein [Chitinophagaceae bacterium]